MSYVSLESLKSYIRNEIDTSDDIDLQEALDAADLLINEKCGRSFTIAGTASQRTYVPDPASRGILRIHDATTVTAVSENGTALVTATDYLLEPVNTTTWAGEVRPYEQIRRQGVSPWYSYNGTGTVAVTATWGWAAIPTAVKMAAKILAKDILSHRDVKFGLVGVTDFGGIRARQANLVGDMLDAYVRPEAAITSHCDLVRSDWADGAQMPTGWDTSNWDSLRWGIA